MLTCKIRYKSAQKVVSGHSTPGVVSTIPPIYCRTETGFQRTAFWLKQYESIISANNAEMRSNECTLTKFRQIPGVSGCSLSDVQLDVNGEYGSSGVNVDALVYEGLFPHGELPYAPNGSDTTEAQIEDNMGGPCMYALDLFDEAYDLDAIGSSGLQKIYNRVAKLNDISIINFMIELREVPRMINNLKRLAIKGEWHKLIHKDRGAENRKVRVADAYLEYKFGYCPLIRDIISILKALASFRKRLKRLLTETHKVRKLKCIVHQYARDPLPKHNLVYEQFGEAFCDGVLNYEHVPCRLYLTSDKQCVPEFWLKYSLYCEDMSLCQLELRGLLSIFGVEWNPAIIWNAIPFSFILDWIWDVGAWLAKWTVKRPLPVHLRIHDSHIKWKFEGVFRVESFLSSRSVGNDYVTTTKTDYVPVVRFRRVEFSPDFEHLNRANWDKNVIDKTFLSAALVTTIRAQQRLAPRRDRPRSRTLKQLLYSSGATGMTKESQDARAAAIRQQAERMAARLKRIAFRRKQRRRR